MQAAAVKTVLSKPVEVPKHPLRYAIHGDTHFVDEIKKIVQADDKLTASLKSFVCEELSGIKTNAAEVHLHLIDHRNGGISLNLHISPRTLGRRNGK